MQTKTYFASSVPAALETARQELGDDALLVGSRPTPPSARQFGRLEVTFAWESRPAKSSNPAPPASEMDQIRQQLSDLRVALDRGVQPTGINENSLMADRLIEAGFSRASATDIASGAARRSGKPDAAVVEELTARIPVAPFVEMKSGEGRTLAFIGPPGRGKTTSLVKIALVQGLAKRVPVRIYCAGSHAIGAPEQLARLAAILGTPYQVCESLAGLNLALNGDGWKGLSLIDTPGISPADRTELSELTRFFGARPEIEKHLVLRADTSSADMLHTMFRFSGLTPSRLLFTGMDEAISATAAIETLISGGIPATFAGTGQQIPEDLEEMSPERLARSVWAGPAAVTQGKFAQAAA